MVFFNEIEPWEDVLAYDDVGFIHVNGDQTKGRLILTQLRLVFVTGGEPFEPKLKTEHAINMSSIERALLEPAEGSGVILRVLFSISIGHYVARYYCRLAQAEKFVELINQRVNLGNLR